MSLDNGAIAAVVFAVVLFVLIVSSSIIFWYWLSFCVAKVGARPNHPDPPYPYQQVSVKDLAFHVDKEKQQEFIQTKILGTRFMRFFIVPGHDCENLSRAPPCPAAPPKPLSPKSGNIVPIKTHVDGDSDCQHLSFGNGPELQNLASVNGPELQHLSSVNGPELQNLSSETGPSCDPQICPRNLKKASRLDHDDLAHPLIIDISMCPKCDSSTHASADNDTFGQTQTVDRYSKASAGRRSDDCSSSSGNEENVAGYLHELENELLVLQCQDGQSAKVVARDTLLFNLHTYGHMRLGEQILEAEDSVGGGYIPLRGVVVVQSKTVVSLEEIVILPGDLICVMQFIETVPENGLINEPTQLTQGLVRSEELELELELELGLEDDRPRMTCSGYLLNVCVEQNGQFPQKIVPRAQERMADAPLWVSEIPVKDVSRL